VIAHSARSAERNLPRTADYAVSIVLVVTACFIYWMWKVTSAGGTIIDGAYVAFTWAIPAVIAATVVTRAIERGRVGRSLYHEGEVGRGLGKMPSMTCTNCGKEMRYSFSKNKWVCDKCQTLRDGPPPIRPDANDDQTSKMRMRRKG